jgi:activator of HSP90 ATPase
MDNGFRIKTTLPAEPKAIYKAWLSGAEHTAMTGGAATASAEVGGRFTAWDGYISGRNVSLKPHWCIVQFWRTTQFSPGDPDSRLELCIHPKGGGSEVLLIHTGIPADQLEGYRSGWVDHYFEPMKKYFAARKPAKRPAKRTAKTKTTSKKKRAAKKKTAKRRTPRRRRRR